MHSAFRSTRAGIILTALLAVQLGCTTVNHVPVTSAPAQTEITGITKKSGATIEFAPKGAIISRDTLYANTANGQVVVPLDSIQTLSLKEVSTKKTIGLILITGVVVVGFVLLANKTAGMGSSSYSIVH
jgi:hypothetical protein